ncbi:MAG: SAM-dependent methyltransferase [Leptospirales bacterium]|nr:SAM-dependent methyltransferase [Leptospirales bacterium]
MAELTALARAISYHEWRPELRCADSLAHRFLPWPLRAAIALRPLRRLIRLYGKLCYPGAYEYVAVRTQIFDEAVAASEFQQLVILGAGADSRAWRLTLPPECRVFAADHPQALQRRWRQLQSLFAENARPVRTAAIDLDQEDPGRALVEAGFDADRRSLFLLEGVTMYLDAASVLRLLAFVGNRCAAGSAIIFDYAIADALHGGGDYPGLGPLLRISARKGEPMRTGFDPLELVQRLAQLGLELEWMRTAQDLRSGLESAATQSYSLPGFYGLVRARRPQ